MAGKHVKHLKYKKNGKKRARRIIGTFILVLFICLIGLGCYGVSLLFKMKTTKLPDASQLGITQNAPSESETGAINILLFGLDRRPSDTTSRSDSIIIATIDKKSKQIKLTSLMRDMYVPIPGHSKNRINAAYQLGGPALAIKTVNTNFNMDISRYVTVDFFGLEKVIDKIGGVEIDVKKYEVNDLNHNIGDVNAMEHQTSAYVTHSGLQTLTGREAVAYARIRHSGNSDFERTQRQRYVLNQLLAKVKSQGLLKMPSTISTILPYVETNINKTEIISLAAQVATFPSKSVEQYRIPVDGFYKDKTVWQSGTKMDVMSPDIQNNTDLLHKFIYGANYTSSNSSNDSSNNSSSGSDGNSN